MPATMENRDHTLIFTGGGGRLGNQLINYANLISFSLEYPDFDVKNLSFSSYVSEYGNHSLYRSPLASTPLQRPWDVLAKLAECEISVVSSIPYFPSKWLRWEPIHRAASYRSDAQSIIGSLTHGKFALTELSCDRYEQFDLTATENITRLRSRPVSVIAGWGVRAWPLVNKHKAKLRSLLQPGESHRAVADQFVESLRDKYDVLVGALVRQGDYRNWSGGQYFFQSSEYRDLLKKFVSRFPNKDVGILLASDEQQPESVFDDDQFIFTTGIAGRDGHYVESFTELSLCDVVVTPPSTFSVFAAFLGDIPVVPLHNDTNGENWEWLESPLIDSVNHSEMKTSVK